VGSVRAALQLAQLPMVPIGASALALDADAKARAGTAIGRVLADSPLATFTRIARLAEALVLMANASGATVHSAGALGAADALPTLAAGARAVGEARSMAGAQRERPRVEASALPPSARGTTPPQIAAALAVVAQPVA